MDSTSEECLKARETAHGKTEDFRLGILEDVLPGEGNKKPLGHSESQRCSSWALNLPYKETAQDTWARRDG